MKKDEAVSEDKMPSKDVKPDEVATSDEKALSELLSESSVKDRSALPLKLSPLTKSIPTLRTKSPLKSALKKRSEKELLPALSSPSLALISTSRMPEFQMQSKSFIEDSIAEVPREEEDQNAQNEKAKVKFILGASDMDVEAKSLEQNGGDHIPLAQKTEIKDKIAVASSTPKKAHRRGSQIDYKCDDLTLRKHQGSDLESKSYHEVLEPDEAKDLPTADIDDLASHRFDDPKGIRRHKIRGHSLSFSRHGDGPEIYQPSIKKTYDHKPHEVFVQLDELLIDDYNRELVWRERARWIKYEEDVQVSAERWGKPHVSSLSFHSLLNLRHCLESGAVLLDQEVVDFDEIIDKIVDSMIDAELLKPQQKTLVVKKLLLRHRHGNVRIAHPVLRRSSAAYINLNQCSNEKNSPGFLKSSKSKSEVGQKCASPETAVLISSANSKGVDVLAPPSMKHSSSYEDTFQLGTSILRRIPENAEGSIVLVGALDALDQPAVAFMRLSEGHVIPYLLEVPIPVRFLFVLLGPPNFSDMDYHEIGRSIGTLMSNRAFHEAAYQANDRKDLLSAINTFLDDSVVLPPSDFEKRSLLPLDEIRRKSTQYRKRELLTEAVDERVKIPVRDPLKRTGKWFGGFMYDIQNRFPLYVSDLKDGVNSQCLASTVFIYFAALAGAIAFGGLYGDKTTQLIGVSETLVATCACGVLYALFSCQPLVVLGTTGPVLMFDEILFQFCENFEMNYLIVRVYVAIWTAIIATIVVGLEGSSLVRFFSRFMQEIYATVIATMYIVESLIKLIKVFLANPLQSYYPMPLNTTAIPEDPRPNTALLSFILMIGTFYIAYSLRKFRNSKFLSRPARRALGDFGVPIAMAVMVLIDYCISDVYTQKLNVPEGFSPSKPNRGWLICPWPVTILEIVTAAVAGLLIFILLFLETQICELIVAKKERNLKKGTGFHADMMLISYVSILCGVIGGPWVCAATVRSISHVSSLTVWSKTHAPGEVPHIVEVKEQRLTNFFVSVLIGLSVLMTPVLQQVPVAVLFGVFLYMGVSALSGIQLCERIMLMFMPPKHHPDNCRFVREVQTSTMYWYTLLQIGLIMILWVIKCTILAPGFPFGLLALVFIHAQVKKCFSPTDLKALDGEEENAVSEDEPDFYEQIVA